MRLTPTERRILDLLADGLPHSREELARCLPDDLASPSSVGRHLTGIRRALPPGEAVLAVYHRRTLHYQHVILLPCVGT